MAKTLKGTIVDATDISEKDWEVGLKIGSKDWIAAAEKNGSDRLRLQYYGLSKDQWNDMQKSTSGVVDDALEREAAARVVKFDSQPDVVKQRADAARSGPPPRKYEPAPATPVDEPGGMSTVAYVGIAAAALGIAYFLYRQYS